MDAGRGICLASCPHLSSRPPVFSRVCDSVYCCASSRGIYDNAAPPGALGTSSDACTTPARGRGFLFLFFFFYSSFCSSCVFIEG